MSNRTADFSQKTKNILAGRAGYQCSHPNCDRITIGPAEDADKISSTGEAAHIYSASKDGPRGQHNLSVDKLKSLDNGIWMCKNHARLIDTNSGDGFSVEQLHSWKYLHEEKIKKHQGRLHRNISWVNSIEIAKSTIFKCSQKIILGKITYIVGKENASGKATLLEILTSLSTYKYLDRWLKDDCELNFEIDFYNPDKSLMSVDIYDKNIKTKINNDIVPFNPISIITQEFTYKTFKWFYSHEGDDLVRISELLNVDKTRTKEIISNVGNSKYSFVKNLRFVYEESSEEDEEYYSGYYLHADVNGTHKGLSLNQLSGGETSVVLLEIIISKMQIFSKYTPCLLLISLESFTIDKSVISSYMSFLLSSEIDFQTVITSLYETENDNLNTYELVGSVSDIEIKASNKLLKRT